MGTYVAKGIDYIIKRDRRNHPAQVSLSVRQHDIRSGDWFDLTIHVSENDDGADTLHEIFRAGAIECTVRPIKLQSDDDESAES